MTVITIWCPTVYCGTLCTIQQLAIQNSHSTIKYMSNENHAMFTFFFRLQELRNYFVWLIQGESPMDCLLACYFEMEAIRQSQSMKE